MGVDTYFNWYHDLWGNPAESSSVCLYCLFSVTKTMDIENDWIATTRPLCDVVYVAPCMHRVVSAKSISGY